MAIRSSFYGIEIGKSGIAVSQAALDTAGHNIANVETLGFTRQRIVNTAYDPYNANMQWRPVSGALVGGGANVLSHNQIRNIYMDRTFRTQQSIYSTTSIRNESLGYMETIFEKQKGSFELSNTLGEFFTSISDIGEDGASTAYRKNILSKGQNLVGSVNTVYKELIDQQTNHNLAVKEVVTRINSITTAIRDLNEDIYRYEADGISALDLRDQRNLLLDELSAYVDIEYEEYSDTDNPRHTKLRVTLGGDVLIDHKVANSLGVMEVDNVIDDEEKVYSVIWETMNGKKTQHSAANEINGLIEELSNNRRNPDDCREIVRQLKKYFGDDVAWNATHGTLSIDGREIIAANGEILDLLEVDTLSGFNFVKWESDGEELDFEFEHSSVKSTGGELMGHIIMRDGTTSDNTVCGIPYYVEQLNDYVRALVQEVNQVHANNWTDDLAPGGSHNGVAFFNEVSYVTRDDGTIVIDPITRQPIIKNEYGWLTAKNFDLSDELKMENGFLNIAVASREVDNDGTDQSKIKGEQKGAEKLANVLKLMDIVILKNGKEVPIGSLENYVTCIHSHLANDKGAADQKTNTYGKLTAESDLERASVSSVSLDEEMTSIITFQHAFTGASRVINAMDDCLDMIVNRTGRVGL